MGQTSPLTFENNCARRVFSEFLAVVVAGHVFSDAERTRRSGPLKESEKKEIASQKRIDARVPFLAAISGKGGQGYERWTNVSLLDHLCSVVRGALVFAELDLRAAGVAEAELAPRLAGVAAIGFLHDADKMLQIGRCDDLTPARIKELMIRYGVDRFLAGFGVEMDPALLLACIDEIEVTRMGRLRPGAPFPDRTLRGDCKYVQLADRLDGKFLDTDPDEGGVDAVLRDLARFEGLRTGVLQRAMRVLRIDDPHSTFLLDELQTALSEECWERHGHPPLIEVHHDGRLLCVAPEDGFDDLLASALRRTTRELGALVRIDVNARGAIRLLDATATADALRDAMRLTKPEIRRALLAVKRDFARARRDDIDRLFQDAVVLPQWQDLERADRQLIPMFAAADSSDDAREAFLLDAHVLSATLSCSDADGKGRGIPDSAQREAELMKEVGRFLPSPPPAWLMEADSISRRAILAAGVAAAAQDDNALRERLYGADGLIALWLEGRGDRRGLNAAIDAAGQKLAEAVSRHFTALASGRLVRAEDESCEGRCHFTNAPTPRSARITTSTGLYAVNVSAFSGRETRPETFRSTASETLVSPIAEAEYRLRQIRFGKPSVKRDIPVRVSSPVTAGLFPALAYDRSGPDDVVLELTFADALRLKVDKGKRMFSDLDGLARRLRVGRYEAMPTRLVSVGAAPGQITFVKMAFEVAWRTGRPIHVFRGLPRPQPAFVAFDSLPPALEIMLGGQAFRLEQIAEKIRLLRGVEAVAEATGFGVELAFAVGDPRTRFASACDALARCDRRDGDGPEVKAIREFVINLIEQSETLMTETDQALVAFGEAMARVQRAPIRSDGGAVSETGMRVALDAALASGRMGQTSIKSLINAVGGSLQDILTRRGLYAARAARESASLDDALSAAAEIFVRQVWLGAFKGRCPAMRFRRVAIATYRWAFEREARRLRQAADSTKAA